MPKFCFKGFLMEAPSKEEALPTLVTARFRPWRRMKYKVSLQKFIDIEGNRFYWNDNGGKRIYTFTYADGDTLSFSLGRGSRGGFNINIDWSDLPLEDGGGPVFAILSGRDTEVRRVLEGDLKKKGCSVISYIASGMPKA